LKRYKTKKLLIEDLKLQADQAERQGEYGRVAEIRYGKIKEAEKEIARLQQELIQLQAGKSLIKEEVDSEDIAAVVARWTGIPVSKNASKRTRKNFYISKTNYTCASLVRMRLLQQLLMLSGVQGPGCRTTNDQSVHLFSLELPVFGKTELAKSLSRISFRRRKYADTYRYV